MKILILNLYQSLVPRYLLHASQLPRKTGTGESGKMPLTKGQLVQGGYSQIGARGQAKPSDGVATLFSVLFTVPSAKYTYKANGREYAGSKTLCPV